MKIAILYSGHLRNYAEVIHNNIEYFRGADIDLYFSLWDNIGYTDHLNDLDYINSNRIIDNDILITSKLIEKYTPKSVNIKSIKIEKYTPYSLNLINGINNGLANQYYKIFDCFNLINDQYDFLIRLRCDVLLNNQIDIKELHRMILNNKIVFNTKVWYNHPKSDEITSINEMIWISNYKLMKKSCNIYNNEKKINEIITKRKIDWKNYGENITHMNLEAEKILDNIELFDFDYTILR